MSKRYKPTILSFLKQTEPTEIYQILEEIVFKVPVCSRYSKDIKKYLLKGEII